jgi:hypothetical protein
VKGSPYFSLNFACFVGLSGLTPRTTAPRVSNSSQPSRIPHACLVQPGVSSRGVEVDDYRYSPERRERHRFARVGRQREVRGGFSLFHHVAIVPAL